MTANDSFYTNLKSFDQFQGFSNLDNYSPLPHEWAVVITDIEGSTLAIQQGKYRQVNAIGVASIVAVLNTVKPLSIPFVFGGDGATLCIPQSYIQQVKEALMETKLMAKENFSLQLRCGIVPYLKIDQSQHPILIGKCKISKGYYQAVFSGNGLAYAEQLVKNDPQGIYCFTDENSCHHADFTGFECRWKDVPSPHDETVSLLVMSLEKAIHQSNSVYLKVFNEIQKIYGNVESHKPVQKEYLELTTKPQNLQDEVRIRAGSKSKLEKIIYAILLPWKVRLGRYLMDKGKQFLGTDWARYKETLVTNTDFRKFDENLRMVISGSAAQREALSLYLDNLYQNGLLVYGIHVSDRALMTCVISDYNLHHIHFVDGADGGYAMAAKALKQQLKVRSESEQSE